TRFTQMFLRRSSVLFWPKYFSGVACPSTKRKLADVFFMCRQRIFPAGAPQSAASLFVPPSTERARLNAGLPRRHRWSEKSRKPSRAKPSHEATPLSDAICTPSKIRTISDAFFTWAFLYGGIPAAFKSEFH